MDIDRTPGLLTKEECQKCIDNLIGYFHSERKETIGVIAAEDMLDFFLQHAGKHVYNTALEHARTELRKRAEDIDFKISELER